MSALILTSEEREFLEILLCKQHSNYLNLDTSYSDDLENFKKRLQKSRKDTQLLIDILDKITEIA